MDSERWAPVPVEGYEGYYEVSDRGRVRRAAPGPSTRPGKIRALYPGPWGSYLVGLHAHGAPRHVAVATLVAKAFLPPPPFPGAVLKHRDGDHANSAAENLMWTTRAERGARCGRRPKLSPAQVAEILALRGVKSGPVVARQFGVSATTVRKVWRVTAC
jgi:hypothetical protein